jgi:hypothetical protein
MKSETSTKYGERMIVIREDHEHVCLKISVACGYWKQENIDGTCDFLFLSEKQEIRYRAQGCGL